MFIINSNQRTILIHLALCDDSVVKIITNNKVDIGNNLSKLIILITYAIIAAAANPIPANVASAFKNFASYFPN